MSRLNGYRVRLLAALVVIGIVGVVAVVLWLGGSLRQEATTSPLETPAVGPSPEGVSLLPTPTPSPSPPSSSSEAAVPSSLWTGAGMALLWVALGSLLALSVAFVVLRFYHHDTE